MYSTELVTKPDAPESSENTPETTVAAPFFMVRKNTPAPDDAGYAGIVVPVIVLILAVTAGAYYSQKSILLVKSLVYSFLRFITSEAVA